MIRTTQWSDEIKLPYVSRGAPVKTKITFWDAQGNVLSRKTFNAKQPVRATITYWTDPDNEVVD